MDSKSHVRPATVASPPSQSRRQSLIKSTSQMPGGDMDKSNQERAHQRVSRIYPISDSVVVAQTKKTPVDVKFHPLTSKFSNEPRLERLYQVTFARENSYRSSRVAMLFLAIYIPFIFSSLTNLGSSDPDIRSQAVQYCALVLTPMVPVPILIYLSRQRQYEVHLQHFYTAVLICWSISVIGGGVYSLLVEWSDILEQDLNVLFKEIDLLPSNGVTFYVNTTGVPEWAFKDLVGTRVDVLKEFMRNILLPVGTVNVNLLRVMIIYILVPLLRIDTAHFAFIGTVVSIGYAVVTAIFFPKATHLSFLLNCAFVIAFPAVFLVIMLIRNRDIDRVVRQEFLHVWAVELEAEKAMRENALMAEENLNLKKELANRTGDFELDLTSPLHVLLSELKTFIHETDMSPDAVVRGLTIVRNLAKLDQNLFMPDIRAQMKKEKAVDDDTKNWALTVLARKDYNDTARGTAAQSVSSHSNSETRRSYYDSQGDMNAAVLPLQSMPAWEDNTLALVRRRIVEDDWNLDTLKIAEITNKRPLMYVAAAMFDIHEIHEEFRIDQVIMRNFLYLIDDGYIENPYHNSCHAADVVNSVNYLMTRMSDGRIRNSLTNLEFYAALLAAAIHDFRHPGKSNNYLIKAQDDLAVQYNDRSILESMHVAEAFFLMRNPMCNIFSRMKDKPYREIRKAIIEMVLSTDLSMHLQLVGSLKALVLSEDDDNDDPTPVNDPMMIMKVVIKCADIGHSSKERRLHAVWSALIIEEFFQQGDLERENNTDISPFMDRYAENSAKNQVGFFEFIVLPFYDTISRIIFDHDFSRIQTNANNNYNLWREADKRQLTTIESIKHDVFFDESVKPAQ